MGVTCAKHETRLMIAKNHAGADVAWGQVGGQWHMLQGRETLAPAMEKCLDYHPQR